MPNILIVDDSGINQLLLKDFCRKIDVNLIIACSGHEALEKIKGIDLALVISDIQLSDMNGYELAGKINNKEKGNIIPIIFLTSEYLVEKDVLKGYECGAVDFIFKPVNKIILNTKINVFIDLFNQKQIFISNAKRQEELVVELKTLIKQQKSLLHYIEKDREQQKAAFTRELHDELGQALTAIKTDLTYIRQQLFDNELGSRIEKVSTFVSETIKTVQRLSSRIRPMIIEDLGLKAAIEWYTKEFEKRYGITVNQSMDSSITLSNDTSLTLFRIFQESLTNIARHANATNVNIRIFRIGKSIQCSISDNGIGIKEEEINSKSAYGIMIMKERVDSLGGILGIQRVKDSGTIIDFSFKEDK